MTEILHFPYPVYDVNFNERQTDIVLVRHEVRHNLGLTAVRPAENGGESIFPGD